MTTSRGHRAIRRAEGSPAELWRWPSAAGIAALVVGLALAGLRPEPGSTLATWTWPGDVAAASTLLQTVAAATIATITLTFSLTVVALQLASQQFSPRLLREFMRDRVTKAALAVLVATFVMSVATLRGLREDQPPPGPALMVTFVLAVASLAAVLGFLNHVTRMLRVDSMMVSVHDEVENAIATFYPTYDDDRPRSPDELDVDADRATLLLAQRSGFVRGIDVEGLVAACQERDAVVRVHARPGDQVVRGTPLASVWPDAETAAALRDPIGAAVVLGYERTLEQDAAFGFRQLTDIAVKALSPGINDPVTAAHAIGHMSDLLVRLTGRRLGGTLHEDADGVGRLVVEDRDLRYYLDLVCGQIRRYGDREPTVLVALLRMLRDVASHVRDEHQAAEVRRQVALVVTEMADLQAEADAERVRDMAERVEAALSGDVLTAYLDRAGETRSL